MGSDVLGTGMPSVERARFRVTSFGFRETQAGETTKTLRRGPASMITKFAPPLRSIEH
jgi:hypothetical protein